MSPTNPAPDPHVELETVRHTAALARLQLTPTEEQDLARELGDILTAFRGLSRIDVEGVEPLVHPCPLATPAREDRARPSLDREALLARAPEREEGWYRVPKTVGGES